MHGIHRQIHTSLFFYKASRVPHQLNDSPGGAGPYCTPLSKPVGCAPKLAGLLTLAELAALYIRVDRWLARVKCPRHGHIGLPSVKLAPC